MLDVYFLYLFIKLDLYVIYVTQNLFLFIQINYVLWKKK